MLAAIVAGASRPAAAQDPIRPWLDWRTMSTRNYEFHFPRDLEAWTRATAERVESIDSAIVALVGYSPSRPVQVVVDDPYAIANGYALPFVDRPVSVWWASPPDPRSDIGDYRTWGEMLATHELTHIAHLTRPSRNPFQRQLWASLPANLGPIARKAPRWVFEGYATTIEGRITGTGRPHNAWRPAILRQWAIEGHLPTYGQLSGWGDFEGNSFAYLGGSAFLEWLGRREGDSSFVLVWRRMTARITRSFDASFAGVYGDAPATLYGLYTAALTRDAMEAKAALERAGLVQGTLVQHLSWGTGDPAISPSGEKLAITVRRRDRPSSVVVWRTAPEPEDTAQVRRRIDAQKRDPQDVPDRRFYPIPKKALKTLPAKNGRPFGQPRWLDNRRVLLTRWTPRADGTLRPDLYIWDTDSDDVRRVTHGAGLVDPDPRPDGSSAIATRCHAGQCDVVSVDLARKHVTQVLDGSPERSYYRPRYSADGSRFAAAVSDGGRWRVVVAGADGSNPHVVGPDDGANRYDAVWLAADSLLVVSERGGIPNLEVMDVASGSTRTLTRVTGAAVAPELNRSDGSIWFLTLHSRGWDVRRLARGAGVAVADSAVSVMADRFGFAGLRPAVQRVPAVGPVSATRAYGSGPRHQRWIPGAFSSGDGAGAFLAVFSGDIVGRLNAILTAGFGEAGTVRGADLRAAWRYPRPAIEAGIHGFVHYPSEGRNAQPFADSLDASLLQSVLALSTDRGGDGWYVRARLGAAAGTLQPALGPSYTRRLEFGEVALRLNQASGSRGMVERLRLHVSHGRTRGDWGRVLGSLEILTSGRDAFPLELGATLGATRSTPHPFDLFTVGGAAPPGSDSSIMSQRYPMPMFPTGIARGKALLAWRVALPADRWTLFYTGASVAPNVDEFRRWVRAIGAEMRYALPPVPVAFSPRITSRGGVAYTLDQPFRRRVRLYLEMQMQP